MIKIEKLVVGSLGTNCYLLADNLSEEAIIIDPGDDAEYIIQKILDLGLKPKAILATHGHFDHILASAEIQEAFNIPFYISKKDLFLVKSLTNRASRWLERKIVEYPPKALILNNEIKKQLKNKYDFQVIETPGHTPGSLSFYLKSINSLFSGDTIFSNGAYGRYDFSYSNKSDLAKSIKRILKLPDKTGILPGHGKKTNIKNEKIHY